VCFCANRDTGIAHADARANFAAARITNCDCYPADFYNGSNVAAAHCHRYCGCDSTHIGDK
jgi:hypothetical protein